MAGQCEDKRELVEQWMTESVETGKGKTDYTIPPKKLSDVEKAEAVVEWITRRGSWVVAVLGKEHFFMWVGKQDVEGFFAWAVANLVSEVTAGNCGNELKALHDTRITLGHRSHETWEWGRSLPG